MTLTGFDIAIYLLVGFIIGWAVEFAWDFLYWRRQPTVGVESDDAESGYAPATYSGSGQVGELRRALTERDDILRRAGQQAAERDDELARLNLVVAEYENTFTHLRSVADSQQAELESLRAAAASPAQELAAPDPQVATLQSQLDISDKMVDELSQRVHDQAAEIVALHTQLEASPSPERLESLEDEIAAHDIELTEAQALLAARQPASGSAEDELAEREAEVRHLAELLDEARADIEVYQQRELERLVIEETEYIHEDDLTDIKGIGDVYGDKLREAGYHTYGHLAQASVDELKSALNIPEWRTPNLQSWIDQANELDLQDEQADE